MTYDAFLKSLGITDGDDARLQPGTESAFRSVYEWAKEHPGAKAADLKQRVGAALSPDSGGGGGGGPIPDWIYNPAKKVVEFVDPARALGRDLGHPPRFSEQKEPTVGPNGESGKAPAPVPPATKPDVASAASRANPGIDPALKAALDAAGAGGITSTISLWSGVDVDPDATVTGKVFHRRHGGSFGRYPTWVGSRDVVDQTADAWLKGLYTMAPQDLAELQHRLWDAGWYEGTKATDPSMVQYGRPDAATVQAYGLVLGETARYNAAGKRIGIDGVIDTGSPLKGMAGAGKGAPFSRTSRADLTSAIRAESENSIGRDLTPDEEARFAARYRADEEAASRQTIAANATNTTVGIDGPGSTSAEAAAFIDANNPADKAAYQAAVRQQAFYSMLKSPV